MPFTCVHVYVSRFHCYLTVFMVLAVAYLDWPSCQLSRGSEPRSAHENVVGRDGSGRILTPVNQVLTPLGVQLDLPGMRPQAVALSPDGSLLITSGKQSQLVVVDAERGTIRQRVDFPSEDQRVAPTADESTNLLEADKRGQLSYSGLVFTPTGDRIFLSNVEGSIKVFSVSADGWRQAIAHVAASARQGSAAGCGNPQWPGDLGQR